MQSIKYTLILYPLLNDQNNVPFEKKNTRNRLKVSDADITISFSFSVARDNIGTLASSNPSIVNILGGIAASALKNDGLTFTTAVTCLPP